MIPNLDCFSPICSGTVLALVVLAAGCGDLDLDPPAELDADAPVAAMRFSEDLPTLPGLVDRWADERGLDPIVEQWTRSWEVQGVQGERQRLEAIHSAVPFLLDAMSDQAVDETLDKVERAVEGVEDALADSLPKGLSGPLERAGREAARTRRARDAGNWEHALAGALLTADHLRSTTPEALAEAMIARGDEALRRISDDRTYPLVTRRRGERLLIGAREALSNGDASLALRRAWYATGLLDADRDDTDGTFPNDSEIPDR